jgi:Bax protein
VPAARPLVLQVNEAISQARGNLIAIRERVRAGESLTPGERAWLERIAAEYNADADKLDELLRRVDIVPPSLALAQAAIESGWGTSSGALLGNALFGQYTTDEKVGLHNSAMREGMDFHIRAFGGLLEAVDSYAHNLNTHSAYKAFRAQREKLRAGGENLDGYKLAPWIRRYSSRGEDYVRDVRRVIRGNDLDSFDDAWLDDGTVTSVVFDDA